MDNGIVLMVAGGGAVGLGLFRWIANMVSPSKAAAKPEQILSTPGTIVHYHLDRKEYRSGPADDPNSTVTYEAQLHIGYAYWVHGVRHQGNVYLGEREGLSEDALRARYPFQEASSLPIYYVAAHPDKSGIDSYSVVRSITKEPPGSLIFLGLIVLALGGYLFLRSQ